MEVKKMNNEEHAIMPEKTGRPFSEIPGLWLKLPEMTGDFFKGEMVHVSASNTLIGVLILTGVIAIISSITSMFSGYLGSLGLQEELQGIDFFAITGGLTIFQFCCALIVTPVSFYFSNGLTYLGARIFGGKGDYTTQAYLNSLYYVPVLLISSVLSLLGVIPIAGGCIVGIVGLGLSIYQFILSVRSMMVVHDLSAGQAVGSLLIIPGTFLLIGICLIVLLALSGPAVGNIFSNIISEIGTPIP
jgi:hypothetical protein